MRLAYADPPYPGKAYLYPEQREVDHVALIARLVRDFPDGWALSTSADALLKVWWLCPEGTRCAAWFRPARRVRSSRPINAWEPLLVYGGRPLPTDGPQGVLDVLDARGRFRAYPGAIVGMKPPRFAVWMFEQLGARPGDTLVDLFPGSGAIGRAWERFASPPSPGDASQEYSSDTSPEGLQRRVLPEPRDAFREVLGDASPRGVGDASRLEPLRRVRA